MFSVARTIPSQIYLLWARYAIYLCHPKKCSLLNGFFATGTTHFNSIIKQCVFTEISCITVISFTFVDKLMVRCTLFLYWHQFVYNIFTWMKAALHPVHTKMFHPNVESKLQKIRLRCCFSGPLASFVFSRLRRTTLNHSVAFMSQLIPLRHFPGVERSPDVGGGPSDEARRGPGASPPGARHRGPHAHPGEGRVRADPSAAEDPVQRRAAVLQPGDGPVTRRRRPRGKH